MRGAITIVLLFFATQAVCSQEIMTACTGFKGYGHDINSGGNEREFYSDGFSEKVIILWQTNSAGKIGYAVSEGSEGPKSQKFDPNPTYLIHSNPTSQTYMIFIDGSSQSYSETYLFKLGSNSSKNGEVVYTQARNGGSPAIRIMHGVCNSP